MLVHTAVVSAEAWRIVAALISWRIPLGFASTGETGLGWFFGPAQPGPRRILTEVTHDAVWPEHKMCVLIDLP